MDPPNTLGVRRSCYTVQPGQEAGEAIHHHILQLEELPHEVSHATQSPEVERVDNSRLGQDITEHCTSDAHTDMEGEGLLEEEVEADISDTEPDSISQALAQDIHTGCLVQGRGGGCQALLEDLAGHQGAHHTQGEVEAVSCDHEEAGGHALPLHLVADPVQGKADTPGIDPGQEDRGEVALVQLAGVVREQGVLHGLQGEHVQAQDV